MLNYPEHITTLINTLKRLPGVGNKTAERYAFAMLEWQPHHLSETAQSISTLSQKTKFCPTCGCLSDNETCYYCNNPRRDQTTLCIVSSIREVFSLESMGEYKGLYHVLGGLLSPMSGITPDDLHITPLIKRVETSNFKEIVIALDSTLEGDATALFLKNTLEKNSIPITRLAFGIPMGSSLDYIDGGTLAYALSSRTSMHS